MRARALCGQVEETPHLFAVLWGLRQFYNSGGKLQAARDLGEELLTLAQRQDDVSLILTARSALGQTLFFIGEFATAREHLEQGMRLADPEQQRALAVRYGAAPGMQCLSHLPAQCSRPRIGVFHLGSPATRISCP